MNGLNMNLNRLQERSIGLQLLTIVTASIFLFIYLSANVVAQTPTQLQILLPGMTAAPGTEDGYTGSPLSQTTGGAFNVTINTVNDNWDVVPGSGQVILYSSDPYAELPAPVNLVNGSVTVSIVLNTSSWQTISVSHTGLPDADSPLVNVISLSYFRISDVGDPDPNVPGQVTAGDEIETVEISARDAGGGLVSSYSGKVYLHEMTDYGNGRVWPQGVELVDGTWSGTVQVFRSGEKTSQFGVVGDAWLRVTNQAPPADMMEIIINCDDEYDLWVNGELIGSNNEWDRAQTYILPLNQGENTLAVRGENLGGIGSGAGFIMEVRVAGLVVLRSNNNWVTSTESDTDWNSVEFDDSGWGNATVVGPYGIEPWDTGIEGFPMNSQANWIWGAEQENYFRASFDVSGASFPSPPESHTGESKRFCVAPENFDRLLVVMPGESYLPGSLVGRSGVPLFQQGGIELSVDVYATDMFWNQIKDVNHTISMTSTDQNAVLQAFGVMNEGHVDMSAEFNTGGVQTVTVIDDSDGNIISHKSSPVSVLADRIDHFIFDQISIQPTAAQSFPVIITAADASGELVDDFNAVLDLSASTGAGTISPTEIEMENGWWSGNITITRSGTPVTLTVMDRTETPHNGVSNAFTVQAGQMSKLQILLPGESATPGVSPGKVGVVGDLYAGDSLLVAVRAVDDWWNVIPGIGDVVRIQGSDSGANLPADVPLTNGTLQYSVELNSTGVHYFTATNQTSTWVKPDTSVEYSVNSGILDHFIFDQFGSTHEVGKSFQITVTAVDAQENPIDTYSGTLSMTVGTGEGTYVPGSINLTGGFWTGNVTITKAATSIFLSVSDNLTSEHTGNSHNFNVLTGELVALQVLLPGENATPGIAPGKTGIPVEFAAGSQAQISVRAVDAYWNPVMGLNETLVIGVTDSFAVLPGSPSLVDGEAGLSLTFKSAGSHTFSANLSGQPVIPTVERGGITVTPNVYSRLLLLMPGESVLPGDDDTNPQNSPGRTGTTTVQTVGLPFTVSVLAIDNFWNPVVDAPMDRISLSSADEGAILNPAENTLVNGRATFQVTFSQGGNQVVRAENVSNPGIVSSPDGVADVLLGGLHYQVLVDTTLIRAGTPFEMQITFRNGVDEIITDANHFVSISAVSSQDLSPFGIPQTSSIALQSGVLVIDQVFNQIGNIRFKVVDELGTAVAYSEPVESVPGPVASIQMEAGEREIRGLAQTTVTAALFDVAGNPVPNQDVLFEVMTGSGEMTNNTVNSGTEGIATVDFTAGITTETNVITASVDTVSTSYEIIVNLTPSTAEDGQVVNYPNPFGSEFQNTLIDYYLAEDANVRLQIFDLFGNLVWSADFDAGAEGGMGRTSSDHPNSIEWEGVNDQGQKVGNGGYILVAKAVANGKVIMSTQRKIAVLR